MENFGFDIVSSTPAPVKIFIGLTVAIFALWLLLGILRGRQDD